MPAYNFKKQFAPMVESGLKRQTIRLPRKRPTRVGDTLYLYTGMRTKQCRKLRVEKCTSVWTIEIATPSDISLWDYDAFTRSPWLLRYDDMLALANADGFETIGAMTDFFAAQYGLPFTGRVIRWLPDTVTCIECKDTIPRQRARILRELSDLSLYEYQYLCQTCYADMYGTPEWF